VPTLGGHVMLKIPPETQTGKLFRMRNKGVQSVRSHRTGDLLCRVAVETPVKLSKQQKELLREFEESFADGQQHNPRASSWMDSVREFFDRL